jgi:Zn-dependent M28 family amino/carboxypeptidase
MLPPVRTRAFPWTAAAATCAALGLARGAAGGPPPPEKPADITKAELQDWVRTLAADAFEGRESGHPGCDKAAELIAAEWKRLGLAPAGDAGTWFQEFTIPRGMKVLPETSLSGTDATGKEISFALAEDFVPLDVSAAGDVTAEAVFAGYGVRATDLGYDDYEGIDVQGKVVVVLRRAPAYQDKKSPFAPTSALQRYGSFQAKADAAAGAGAAALVIVNDPASSTTKEKDDLRPPGGGAAGKIPVVHVAWRSKARLSDLLGISLAKRQQQIDGKVEPRSEALGKTRIRVRCALEPDVRRVRNVAAMLVPGAGPVAPVTTGEGPAPVPAARPKETVVVGAHYDHVGVGRFGSLAKATGKIHNGADDNASGTSALLEIGGWLAPQRAALKRPILLLHFSGEELGLLGSKHYVEKPLVPLEDTVAMLNLDMVGRLRENRLWIGGTGTSPLWPDLLERTNKDAGKFRLTSWPGGKAPSDHQSFYERKVPVLFFFTGLHNDYHTPTDDWNTLEYEGQARVARYAASLALDLATREDRPTFTQCDAGGFEAGPYIGLSVDPRPDGLFVSHVDDKSPAKKAGVKEEDRLVEWNGSAIEGATGWNGFLSAAKPKDQVELVVSRKGRLVTLKVTLGST